MTETKYWIVLLVITTATTIGVTSSDAQEERLPFTCEVFAPGTSAEALAARFGASNVTTGQVPWGGAEGDTNEGTILFDHTSDAKLEVFWHDVENKRNPAWVSVRGRQSRWRTSTGITLGTSLRHIERLNRRPFRLLGFGTDVAGTVMNWSGGRLESQDAPACRVRIRLGPDWEKLEPGRNQLVNQVTGERQYSSGHPAMQSLDPAVYEIFLSYAKTAG